jgi:WD40 repeat protein/tRNA A-37 threonylcarbamoyl transferase component Bud32
MQPPARDPQPLPLSETPTVPPTGPPGPDLTVPPSGEANAGPPFPVPAVGNVPGYEMLGELGRGGMGVVYKARQIKADRLVALKMVLAGGYASSDVLARFQTEAHAVARLQHPNIVQIHEVGEHEGRPFFSLEFCPGGSLEKRLSGTPLPPRESATLVEKLARALQAAHGEQIVHRDLKPANVLLAADGTPKITDFGLAKRLDEAGQTQSGTIVGTPSYMAPEQAGGRTKDIGPWTDVYALGALLYECLTGRPPFRAATVTDTLLQVISEEPVPPRQLNAQVPLDLETVCLKCLHKEPARRYGSAEGLAEDLGRWLKGEPVAARPVGRLEKLGRWCKRNPAVAGLTMAVAVSLVLGTIVSISFAVIAADNEREAQERARAEEQAKNAARAETARAEKETARADEKAEEVRHALYAARQQVAMNAWRENRMDVLAKILARQKPAPGEKDLRGFEGPYLDRLARAPGRRWQSAGPMINGVALSPDERTAITVGFDGKATAWQVATGRKLWDTGTGFRWSVNAAAVSPDGQTVALAGHLGQLQLWTIDGKFRAKLEGHRAQVFGVAFSPDGKNLASVSADLSIRLWEVATGKALGMFGPPPQADNGRPGPRILPQTDAAESVGHTNMVWQAAWSPDGKRLASCSTDGSIKVWSVSDRKLLRTMVGHEGIVIAVRWSPDGRLVAGVSRPLGGAGGGEIKLWNPDTGRAEATFRPPTGGLHAVTFTPDGLEVVTGGQDRTVRVWRKDGRLIAEHRGFRDDVIGLAVGGGGRWAIAGTRAGEVVALRLDATPGKRSTRAQRGTRLAVAADGRLAVLLSGAIHWYEPETLVETSSWPSVKVPDPKKSEGLLSDTAAFVLRRDGETAHNGHSQAGPGTVVWRDAGGRVRHLLSGHTAPIVALAFLPGDRLASADQDGEVRIWSGANGSVAATARPWNGPVRFLEATGDGRLWAGGAPWAPGTAPGRYNRATAKEGRLARLEGDQVAWQTTITSPLLSGAVAPDGRTLVVGLEDGTLVWLDAKTGAELRRLTSASGAVVSLRFSPTQRRLAAGGADGTVRLLEADSGEELLVLEGPAPAPVEGLAFFPDGQRLAASAADMLRGGTMVVWDGRSGGDPPPLLAPDAAWHKARLAEATGRREGSFGPATKDTFAMRYHLDRLSALEPNDLQWPRALLALDQDAGDYRAAATRLDSIVRRWPNDAPMWYDLGNARRELGDVAGAEVAFRKCITLDPKMPEAYCNLGLLLGREGRFAEAVGALSRGHELGMAQQRDGKRWLYPSAAWLARMRRLGEVAAHYAAKKDFSELPDRDRSDLVEVLMLTKRPLAAVRLADPKPDVSPGPAVIGAALRCAEGIGDANALSAADRSAWRAKALAWLRLDFEGFRSSDVSTRARQSRGMRAHPFLLLARGEALAAWPAADREAWQRFWAEVDAAAEGR